jgi:hypothetical protein
MYTPRVNSGAQRAQRFVGENVVDFVGPFDFVSFDPFDYASFGKLRTGFTGNYFE